MRVAGWDEAWVPRAEGGSRKERRGPVLGPGASNSGSQRAACPLRDHWKAGVGGGEAGSRLQ